MRSIVRLSLAAVVVLFALLIPCEAVGPAVSADQLCRAVRDQDMGKAAKLLSQGADPNAECTFGKDHPVIPALVCAVASWNLDMVRLLLDSGANVNRAGGMALLWAVEPGPVLRGADLGIYQGGEVALLRAIKPDRSCRCFREYKPKRRWDIISLLLRKGADPNIGRNGDTPLVVAAAMSDLRTAKMLLNHGALVDGRARWNVYAWPSLMHAVDGGSLEMVNLLVKNGADVNYADTRGVTPLMLAAARPIHLRPWYKELWEELRIFIRHGPGPAWLDPRLLSSPVVKNDAKIVRLLLANGARIDARDHDGYTALDRARIRGHEEIIKILGEFGAKD